MLYGLEISVWKKCTVNQYFFDTMDNELKAYWLGFIFADGMVYVLVARK